MEVTILLRYKIYIVVFTICNSKMRMRPVKEYITTVGLALRP